MCREKSFNNRIMTIPQHLALSFLLAQFDVQPRYGIGGTALVVAAGVLPDLDRLSLLAGWHAHRTCRNAAGHGLPVALAAPLLLGLLGSEVFQLGPLRPLWCWLQIALVAHLVTDVFSCRWPVKLLWPFSVRGWGFGLIPRSFPALALLLYAAAGTALCSATLAPFAAGVGVAGLVVSLTWRACRPPAPLTRQTGRGPVIWQGCDLMA